MQPAKTSDSDENTQDQREYTLSEAAKAAAWRELAALAPTLREAELRVLIHLTRSALAESARSTRASSREIATGANCSRRNVQHAIDALTKRGLIATRAGTANTAAAYLIRFAEVAQMGGVGKAPPSIAGGVKAAPQVATEQRHSGVIAAPPPHENKGLTAPPSTLDIDPIRLTTLDRALTARAKAKNRAEVQFWAGRLAWFREKLSGERGWHPDADGAAQFAEACNDDSNSADWLLLELHKERRKPGDSAAWWVTVALQRIQRFTPDQVKARREELRNASRPRAVPRAVQRGEQGGSETVTSGPVYAGAPENPPGIQSAEDAHKFSANFSTQIEATATEKRLR